MLYGRRGGQLKIERTYITEGLNAGFLSYPECDSLTFPKLRSGTGK
jgi:hypothetical protein